MVLDFEVKGAEQLLRLSQRLKATGDKELQKQARRALRDATKDIRTAIRQDALRTMPKRGGLNEVMAASRITTQIRGSGRNPRVRLSTKTHDPRLDSKGRLRHPVFGNREVWAEQTIDPGWFTKPAERAAPRARGELIIAMKRIERELEGR